ncbi:adenylate/guanylate cyclase domain-containing protein [Candidatus Saccharibacteria bacterium]|nr:MAG: adenylate/guanylate cyclase domain-containing protein [Candidatus Saccharibacteria bacterium]
MRSNFSEYNHAISYDRIRQILSGADTDYQETSSLPHRDKLTFTNGFYANCSAIFVDIRGSSSLPSKYKRPRLAKLYRAYISEVVAVMNGNVDCKEISIVGDGVWGIFDTPLMSDIDYNFSTVAKINSTIKMLNYRLSKSGYEPVEVGIGAAWGRALMVKAGLSGSGLNDVVYMGDVVNHAAKLAAAGNASYFDEPIMISGDYYSNLKTDNKNLLTFHATRNAYHGNIINVEMDEWFAENCP